MSWLRANRWWLPLLPVCLVAALAASAYRVQDLWYDAGLHHEVATAPAGQTLSATESYSDTIGSTSRTFRVRLLDVGTALAMPAGLTDDGPYPAPHGLRVLRVRLAWSAPTDQVLSGCTVALVDDEGRRYQAPDDFSQVSQCVPEGHPGPGDPLTRTAPRGRAEPGEERPASWHTQVRMLVPMGVHLRAVRIWWDQPDYVELRTP